MSINRTLLDKIREAYKELREAEIELKECREKVSELDMRLKVRSVTQVSQEMYTNSVKERIELRNALEQLKAENRVLSDKLSIKPRRLHVAMEDGGSETYLATRFDKNDWGGFDIYSREQKIAHVIGAKVIAFEQTEGNESHNDMGGFRP